MPTHTLTLDKDIICVWKNTVYIFEKSSSLAIGYLKHYMKIKEIKFKTKKDLYNYICKQTSSVIIFLDNKLPNINLNNARAGGMKKLKYIVEDICYINALKPIKSFQYKLDGVIYN